MFKIITDRVSREDKVIGIVRLSVCPFVSTPGLPSRTFARTVSSELIGFCFLVF